MSLRSPRWTFAVLGLFLGTGAPVGAFLLRYVTRPDVRVHPLSDLRANAFFYVYTLIGTLLVFGAAGFVAGANAERLRKAEAFYQTLSEHDQLTGLYNDRALRAFYHRAVERAVRRHESLSLLLVDVDRLKDINDQFGHLVGNQALIHVAGAIRAGKRADDVAARWGGDEFVVLMELADEHAARRVADNILRSLRTSPLTAASQSVGVTVTIGACVGTDISEADDLLVAADRELYHGKQAGRDQLCVIRIGGATSGHPPVP